MIRIELRRRPRRRFLRLVWVAGAVLALGAGGAYWFDRHYGLYTLWSALEPAVSHSGNRSSSGPAPSGRPGGNSVRTAAAVSGPGDNVVRAQDSTSAAGGAPPQVCPAPDSTCIVEDAPSAPSPLAMEASSASQPLSPSLSKELGSKARVQGADACRSVLAIWARAPAVLRLSTLTCSASGDFSLEGESGQPAPDPVKSFLDTLQGLPAQVDLCWWRSPGRGTDSALRFSFQGRLGQVHLRDLGALPQSEADQLRRRIRKWASAAHLQEVAFGSAPGMGRGSRGWRRRYKIWGTGTYDQVRSFLSRLSQVGDVVGLEETVVVPVSAGAEGPARARVYCALDVCVRP